MHGDLETLRQTLPDEAIVELDAVLADASRHGLVVDETEITMAILKTRIAAAAGKLPPLPAELAEIAAHDQGRRYQLSLETDPFDVEALLAVRASYLKDCRAVASRIGRGLSTIAAAWQGIVRDHDKRRRGRVTRQRPQRRPRGQKIMASVSDAQPSFPEPHAPSVPVAASSPLSQRPATVPQPAAPIPSIVVVNGRRSVHWIGGE